MSQKIATIKFLPHTDTRPADLTLIITWTHIFHARQKSEINILNLPGVIKNARKLSKKKRPKNYHNVESS